MSTAHFEELRARINAQLEAIRAPHRKAQIEDYPWLYGALGEVPSEVMFICENPSLAGVANAHVATVDGRAPDIEAQWWGGPRNPAATRFRAALYRLGLKTSHPSVKGGWKCYITNVIKEMNVAGDNRKLSGSDRRTMARQWAPILAWELEQVSPRHVFCVGNASLEHVNRLVPRCRPVLVNHYSGRTGDKAIIEGIVGPVSVTLHGRAAAAS